MYLKYSRIKIYLMLSSFDLKHNTAKITPQTRGDLFILKDIIVPESFVTAKSPRSIKIRRGDEVIRAKSGRKEVLMKIVVEKVELKEKLRLTGKIIEAPDTVDKGYHTIEVEPGKFLKVEKEWKSWEVDKTKKKEYYKAILEKLKAKSERVKKIIIAGPGFTKENIQTLIKEREKDLLEKLMVNSTYQTGNLGLQELLKKGLLEKLGKMSRIEEETKAVERVLEEMGKKAVLGDEIKDVLELGSVELLLVSDEKIRDYEEILDLADEMKTKIMIISSNHPAGERLLGLGGIAALTY